MHKFKYNLSVESFMLYISVSKKDVHLLMIAESES